MRHILGPVAAVIMSIVAANCGLNTQGCKPAMSPAEAEAAYTAELLGCVEKAALLCKVKFHCTDEEKEKALAYSHQCRKDVNRKYGLCDQPWPAVTPCD